MSFQPGRISVAVVTLGCSKNLVDAECMISILKENGYVLSADPKSSDAIIINTCGFIESAKSEAIDSILEHAEYKHPNGNAQYLVVTGCLSQRYAEDILTELPEVDAVLGTGHYHEIADTIKNLFIKDDGEQKAIRISNTPGGMLHLRAKRAISTPSYAWLKIAEGCSNACAYCAIPMIRGPFISRPREDIIDEARYIIESGFREIILTAQDTTRYGQDIYGRRTLHDLIEEIADLHPDVQIRIMYAYMDGITPELIDVMARRAQVMNYLDIPIQHAHNDVLKSMGRKDTSSIIERRLSELRARIPDIVIRSTVMVGFPGETDVAFDQMMDNLKKWSFDRLGCFVFSAEENTRAYDFEPKVDVEVAQDRFHRVMSLQKSISLDKNKLRLNRVYDVMIDSISDDGVFYLGRSYAEAPEVDPIIYVLATEQPLEIGTRYPVRIVDYDDYELTGVTCNEFAQ